MHLDEVNVMKDRMGKTQFESENESILRHEVLQGSVAWGRCGMLIQRRRHCIA